MFYVFSNPGVMERRSITTFGVSSKVGDKPIGFFGTGLKYAIAILLRNKCSIEIHSGGVIYKFHTLNAKVRVNEFDLVMMSVTQPDGETAMDQEIGFTTELGKTWEMWQCFRELACNTLDEKGKYEAQEHFPQTQYFDPNTTNIIISGREFGTAWAERNSILLTGLPRSEQDGVDIHMGESEWVFYRGVRVHKLQNKSKFTYNIQRAMELTEDRTLKYSWMMDIVLGRAIQNCTDTVILENVMTVPDTYHEYHLPWSTLFWGNKFGEVAYNLAKKFDPRLHKDIAATARKNRFDEFVMDETLRLDDMDKIRLEKAIQFCHAIGFAVQDYPIIISSSLPENVLGMAVQDKIYINRRTFLQGTKMVAGTLIEEYIHLKHKVSDNTSQMQNLLIDTICSLGERLTRTPL